MSFNVSDIDITKSGWLSKQCKYSKKWKKTWFTLRASQLMYGDSEQGPFKIIPLHGTVIEESNVKGMKYVFRLKPPKSNRDYLIQATDPTEEQELTAKHDYQIGKMMDPTFKGQRYAKKHYF